MVLAALGALVIGAPAEGAMLLFLFSLSNLLQHYAMGRLCQAIQALMQLRPDRARVLRDGQEIEMPVEAVRVGEVFVLRPGDRVPLDGMILRGQSALDESMPVDKEPGQKVFAGTINMTASLEVQAGAARLGFDISAHGSRWSNRRKAKRLPLSGLSIVSSSPMRWECW